MEFLKNLFKTKEAIEQRQELEKIDNYEPTFPTYNIEVFDDKDEAPEVPSLDTCKDWVRAVLGDFDFNEVEIIKNNQSSEKYEIIARNFSNAYTTHPGLIYYLAYCWGKEKGIVLRPDMIWNCILCEFSKHIIETKDKYFNDFRNIYSKEKLSYDGYMTAYDLMDKFRSHVKYEEFFRLISLENFINQPKNFMEIKVMSFCNFVRVEYKKHKMNCKIPKFQVKGNKEDWMKLIGLLDVMIHLISNRFFINYLENIKSLVSNLIMNTFQVMLEEPRLRYQGIKEMIKDIFYIEDNKVKGWGRELYFDCYMNPSRKWELYDFNTHIVYIPYINTKKREACIKMAGLCYSLYTNDFLEPFYGCVTGKTRDVKTYKKLSE